MDFGFDPNQAAGVAGKITSAVGPMLWIMIILALGMIGRMVFVAWGDKFQVSGLLSNMSGAGMIVAALGLFFGGLFIADREVRAFVIVQQKVIDPFMISVLGRDSCNPENDRFCVVVWEENGRELVVKWHDKRVDALKVFGDYDFTLAESLRPVERSPAVLQAAETAALSQAPIPEG